MLTTRPAVSVDDHAFCVSFVHDEDPSSPFSMSEPYTMG